MKVARKRPRQPWELIEIENTLEALQAEVGGPLDGFPLAPDAVLVMARKRKGKPFNFRWGRREFFGTVLIYGIEGDKATDIDPAYLPILPT